MFHCPGPSSGRVQLVLLCPSRSLIKATRGQALALPPMVQACFLVTPQTAIHGAAQVGRPLTVQQLVQQPCQQQPHLPHRQGGCPDFFPAWSPASGTRWPGTTASDDDASLPTS